MIERLRKRIVVTGSVQGVGFRPFVYRLAQRFGLGGFVENNATGVTIEVEGEPGALDDFVRELVASPPPLARIAQLKQEPVQPSDETAFRISTSRAEGARAVWISPDACVCDDCLAELFSPADRRYRYPFINCTNCGPRYTIIMDIPYDRPNTTMRPFTMCDDCRGEYEDPADRRFHAQPNACPVCGPHVELLDENGNTLASRSEAIGQAARKIASGRVVAVKGLSGFHLAADALNQEAVERLRRRKRREEKSLAVMVRGLEVARLCAEVDAAALELLLSRERPIVLLPKKKPDPLAPAVAPSSHCHGVMLPYTPLHYLLLREPCCPQVVVMTSGNISEEPIVTANDEALTRLRGIADFFLVHDRDIYVRADDSVMTAVRGRPMMLRRSRGFVPMPVQLLAGEGRPTTPPDVASGWPGDERHGRDFSPSFISHPSSVFNSQSEIRNLHVLGVGPELKNTICLTRGGAAFLSQHVGDLKNLESSIALEKTIAHLERILQVRPAAIACDLHPLYRSTEYARSRARSDNLPLIKVQHHHAHVAACMAENGVLDKQVIGVVFDGTGYGSDGKIWGGEFLVAALAAFRRVAHLEYVPMPGGDASIEQPGRMAISYLLSAFGALRGLRTARGEVADFGFRVEDVCRMIEAGVNCPLTSSMGRLFDAVSALAGICTRATYEGQPAVELEGAIADGVAELYPFDLDTDEVPWRIRTMPMVRAIVQDIESGELCGHIAAKFHNTIVAMTVAVCQHIREAEGLATVALSGGCFQNRYLSEHIPAQLEKVGFRVLVHSLVPPNDGGTSLGQAAVALRRFADSGASAE